MDLPAGHNGGTGAEPGPGPVVPGDREPSGPSTDPETVIPAAPFPQALTPGAPVPDAPVLGGPQSLAASPHSGFARKGEWDACPPSAALGAALAAASGGEWRCAEASRDEMLGMLRQWQAMEAWAAAGKLGVLRALIRDDDQPLPGGSYRGDLPEGWTKSLTHEVALALSMPAVSADRLMWQAWDLQARLPGLGRLLAAGALTAAKAKAVKEALETLSVEDAATAEALILPDLPGKTFGQAVRLATQAAIAVDPQSATRRREDAEQNKCRVQMYREESGAAALSGRDLPTDQTLAAHANVCARAEEYRDSGAFAEDTRMDQYRVAAYLDLLNGISPAARIASSQVAAVTQAGSPDADDGAPDDDEPSGSPGDGGSPEPESLPRLLDLVIPLATLLGLAERPGESHTLGPLDPDLCRELTAAAAASPATRLCVTVTGSDGMAIGHGCARPARPTPLARLDHLARTSSPGFPAASLPAQLNLTISATRLAELADLPGPPELPGLPGSTGPPGHPAWSLSCATDPGPPGGYGTWTLTLPSGRNVTVRLGPVPTFECDHRHESHAYQPNDTLRHLVQVRDGNCTFPPCSRHARESDFEHATPFDKGGRTCACNAGARSRACHRVKQSPAWNVTQPRPGWHRWQTPSGRSYTQGPKRYPD
jgi:hypothetical protein